MLLTWVNSSVLADSAHLLVVEKLQLKLLSSHQRGEYEHLYNHPEVPTKVNVKQLLLTVTLLNCLFLFFVI